MAFSIHLFPSDHQRTANSFATLAEAANAARALFSGDLDVLVFADKPKIPKLAFFDFDATLTVGESLDELAEKCGLSEKICELTAKAMRGEMDFKQSLDARLEAFMGVSLDAVEDLSNTLALHPSAREFTKLLRMSGTKIYIVSGGFHEIIDPIARELGAEAVHAQRLAVKSGRLTGKISGDYVDGAAKAEFVRQTIAAAGYRAEDCVAFGDGANDRLMMQCVGLGVGINAKPILYPYLHSNVRDYTNLWLHVANTNHASSRYPALTQ